MPTKLAVAENPFLSSLILGIDFGSSKTALAYVRGKGEAEPLYDSVQAEGNPFYPPADGKTYRLKDLKVLAETRLAAPVREGVISYSPPWKEKERAALLGEAKAAGFEKISFVAGPCAAVLGLSGNKAGHILVCDYGAGHFSFAVVHRKSDGGVELLFEQNDYGVGGYQIDCKAAERFMEEMELETGKPLAKDRKVMATAMREIERAKRALAHRGSWDLRIQNYDIGLDFKRAFSRYELTEFMQGQLLQIEGLCREGLASCKISPRKFSALILTGGMSRHGAFQERLTKIFGRKPEPGLQTDFLIPRGAALSGEKAAVHGL